VLGQSLRELECICIDDASPDRCGEILDEYAARDERVRVLHLPENHMQGYGRNRGLEMAKGKYVYFLDSDDMITPNAMEELYQLAERDDLEGIYFDSQVLLESEDLATYAEYYICKRTGEYPDEVMTGQALMFLDSDDAFHPDIVQTLLDGMNREGADLAICRFTNYSTTGRMKPENIEGRPANPAARPGVYDRLQAMRALADAQINISVWNKLYRRELWDVTRFPEGRVFEDLDTAFPVFARAERVLIIGQNLYLHRISGGTGQLPQQSSHWSDSLPFTFMRIIASRVFSQRKVR
jgi:glycosyltransferase involved in cell wall biosynthesis